MSKWKAITGTLKVFWQTAKEEWNELDHKLFRMMIGAVSFTVAALFWYYVLRGFSPF